MPVWTPSAMATGTQSSLRQRGGGLGGVKGGVGGGGGAPVSDNLLICLGGKCGEN